MHVLVFLKRNKSKNYLRASSVATAHCSCVDSVEQLFMERSREQSSSDNSRQVYLPTNVESLRTLSSEVVDWW